MCRGNTVNLRMIERDEEKAFNSLLLSCQMMCKGQEIFFSESNRVWKTILSNDVQIKQGISQAHSLSQLLVMAVIPLAISNKQHGKQLPNMQC